MRTHYNKLIRDRIPDIIAADGKTCAVSVLDEPAYLTALAAKLVEEAQEVQAALQSGHRNEIMKELADLNEVIAALLAQQALPLAEVQAVQADRRARRGGFAQRLQLLWVDATA